MASSVIGSHPAWLAGFTTQGNNGHVNCRQSLSNHVKLASRQSICPEWKGTDRQGQHNSRKLGFRPSVWATSKDFQSKGEASPNESSVSVEEAVLALFVGGIKGGLQKLPEPSAKEVQLTKLASRESKERTLALQPLGKKEAWGLAISAVTGRSTTGWVTGSGLEGPSTVPLKSSGGENQQPLEPLLSRSPRRRMAVEFTCNKCGTRTTRAINPHAYKEGTVFVQCKGCEVFHKLVDNLGLFHEIRGPVFGPAYRTPDIMYHEPYDPFA